MTQFECDAILFDLDGVLVDSTSCITRHWEGWARRHGLEIAAVMQVAHGFRTVETIRLVAPHLDAEKEAERITAIEVADTEGVEAIEGALSLLEGLPEGAWAIVTSGSQELARARLRRAGLPVPQTIVSGDDVSQGKPAPEPYLVGANRLGKAAEDIVVIEDAPAGIESARSRPECGSSVSRRPIRGKSLHVRLSSTGCQTYTFWQEREIVWWFRLLSGKLLVKGRVNASRSARWSFRC